ncbi:MAG: hypothetical protein QM503_10630 [Bacteroidota bacterium]
MKTKDKKELSSLHDMHMDRKVFMTKRDFYRMKQLEQMANQKELKLSMGKF